MSLYTEMETRIGFNNRTGELDRKVIKKRTGREKWYNNESTYSITNVSLEMADAQHQTGTGDQELLGHWVLSQTLC